jgi:Holliday junction resolvase RusA-like endonuclease
MIKKRDYILRFISKRKPRSFNAGTCQRYKDDIRRDFSKNRFRDVPLGGELYSRIYYFHAERTTIDADNLSKPIVDALKGGAYSDDNIIVFRASARIDIFNAGIDEFDVTNIPAKTLKDLLEVWDSEKHFLYIEIGQFSNKMILFGGNAHED